MQHHGCRSLMRDHNKLTALEERFDLVVDSNDVILEKVVRPTAFMFHRFVLKEDFASNRAFISVFQGILLDEADGVNRGQQPVMPVGFQPPKVVVSSWNRKVG